MIQWKSNHTGFKEQIVSESNPISTVKSIGSNHVVGSQNNVEAYSLDLSQEDLMLKNRQAVSSWIKSDINCGDDSLVSRTLQAKGSKVNRFDLDSAEGFSS